MEHEADKMVKEESLRNTSGVLRAVQAVGMVLGVMWLSGSFRASALEKEAGLDQLAQGVISDWSSRNVKRPQLNVKV